VSTQQSVERPGVEISPARRALLEAMLSGRNRAAGIVRRAHGQDVPLSFAQERLWFIDRLQQGGAAYNISAALRLSGALDVGVLARAFDELVRRHEALRTTFREVDGIPMQVIHPHTGFTLAVEDLGSIAEADREREAARRVGEDAGTPFDLVAGPLFRATLLRLGDEEHVLAVCVHHIVSDGWSMGVLFRELWALVTAFTRGLASPLAEPALQYADFAVWQRDARRDQADAPHLRYWREQLAGAPALLELPTDHTRPPIPSFRGGRVPVSVPARVVEPLRELARAENATLFMVVLAAFQTLLSRYAGTTDVVVGTPVAGRTRAEAQELVGLFVNTLVLRADLSGDPSFRQALGRVREMVLGAYEHQEVPFERVVAELQPERSLSHSTLFQVMFQLDTLEEGPPAPPGGAGLRVSREEAARDGSKFDLTLDLDAHARGITGILEYSGDLFERGTARRMAEHLERVLEQVAEHPDRRLSRLELMGRAERERVLGWNRTTARYPAGQCIHQLFEAQAGRTPEAPAVVSAGGSLTYAQLDARANRLARHLAALGVGPEARVGICLERGPEMMVAILGVMKAGGAWVPLDRTYPAERLAYMLGDSGARVVVTQESVRPTLPPADGVAVVSVDGDAQAIAAHGPEPVASGVTSENLAYVIYTSGSTGRPKGVAMHHRGVSNYIHWGIRAYGADAGNGAPVFSSIAVDLTITNFLPLFAGLPVRLLDEESPVEALAQALREAPGFGMIKITPVHLALLNAMLRPEDLAGAARTLVVGADFLNAEPTVFWQEHAPGVRLMNEYGPTETVVGCSAYVLPTGKHQAGPVPVGHPIQNLTFHVLDARMEPVPVGLPGELYIGGAGVARGYLGRPGLSAEKFVPDPFAGAGARMYRSGDRARWLHDGNLVILGRADNQVKVRGFRVELGEVEAALRRSPGVRGCLVVVREDRPGDRRLVAYVVADAVSEAADPSALRERLRATLPEYMVPDAFVRLDSLPNTATGKVDPKTLPAPEYAGAGASDAAPADFTEVQLIQIWEELLGVEGIGPTQSFFDLGGNSFLALRLFAQVNRRFECDLPVSTLFTGATVRRMAEAIHEIKRGARRVAKTVVPLQPGGSLPPLYCVHSADRGVVGYVNLVRHLGADQPVMGIQDLGEDLGRPVATIAAEHIRALRQEQPHGPYYLLGWSFGGFVAFEMAVQLEAAGEQVAFLGLMDSMSPYFADHWPFTGDLDLILGIIADAAAHLDRQVEIDRGALEGLDPDEQIRRAVQALHVQGAAPANYDAEAVRAEWRVLADRIDSIRGFAPGSFGGTITHFRAGGQSAHFDAFLARFTDEEKRTLGWNRYSPRPVQVHVVPGIHATIGSEPHVRVLARALRESLAAARAAAGGAA
jgi:amino acid adenylation domain-containing protein